MGILCLLTLALTLHAELGVPALTGRVVDQAGLLSAEQLRQVEQVILDLEAASGGQMAVLTLPSLEGEDLEGFSIRVAEKWQIGHQGKDDGAILLVVSEDRKIRLEIGYGWEGSINDARAGDIIRDMGPYFRSRDYAGGMTYAIHKVQEFVTGSVPVDVVGDAGVTPAETPEVSGWVALAILFMVIVGFIVLVFIFGGKSGGRSSGRTFSSGGGFSSGFSSGGFSSGGGFSGGGGSFGGGGASGGW